MQKLQAHRLSGCTSKPCARRSVRARAGSEDGKGSTTRLVDKISKVADDLGGLGDALGPIGLSYSASTKAPIPPATSVTNKASGLALGPIGLSFGSEFADRSGEASTSGREGSDSNSGSVSERPPSIASLSTAEWRARYEREDGSVDLWVEEEFNSGSRLVGGRAVHLGGVYGFRTGEGPSSGAVAVHRVKVHDHYGQQELDVEVPQDRYILWEAEDQGLQLPYACRMGCCTACAVRVKSGSVEQVEALGISSELRQQGYALMCVAYPTTDCVLETVPEDEIYELQFGSSFSTQALDPDLPSIERDDFALSIANMDE